LEARIALVKFYLLQRKLSEAANNIDSILQKEPQNIKALLLLAGLRELEKIPHEAIVIFRKIIELDSRHEPAYRGLARSLMQEGKTDDAESVL
jgi:Tfp pilus assembly protein PilF